MGESIYQKESKAVDFIDKTAKEIEDHDDAVVFYLMVIEAMINRITDLH